MQGSYLPAKAFFSAAVAFFASPSLSTGHPVASTLQPLGVFGHLSRPSNTASPSLSIGQPLSSTTAPFGVPGQRSLRSETPSPSVSQSPSRRAAQRLGFKYEGLFRQAIVYKGRNRDTAWYSVIDSEWPALERAFRRWLDPANFDDRGKQRVRLSELTGSLLKQRS
jgi:hypothetical protein